MALTTPDHVQLFGRDGSPLASGGFKLTGEAREGIGFCRVWLRPIEAWDRYENPRIASEHWDVRAYRKLDSAFEYVPEFTLGDLDEMAEHFEFPQVGELFDEIDYNGDPVHDQVLAWARRVTGATKLGEPADYTVREPHRRYDAQSGSVVLDFDRNLAMSASTPAPLGGVQQNRPSPIPASAKKAAAASSAGSDTTKPAKSAPSTPAVEPAAGKPSSAANAAPAATPPKPKPAGTLALSPVRASEKDLDDAKKDAKTTSEATVAKPESADAESVGRSSTSPAPPAAPAPAKSHKTTQAMSVLSDGDINEDKLEALRERLAKSRGNND